MRKRIQMIGALLMLLTAYFSAKPETVHAQHILTLLEPVTGSITADSPSEQWSFDAVKGQRLSLRMQATSGDLDPSMELSDASGKSLTTSINASLGNALINAFLIPDTATYTITATRTTTSNKPTTGNYVLSLLPGYGILLLNDPSGVNAPMRTWENANSKAHFANGKLELNLTADSSYTYTNAADKLGTFQDLYMQADIEPQPTNTYWEAGLLVRGIKVDNTLEFYIVFVNSDNKWKVAVGEASGLSNVNDWTPLPAASLPAASQKTSTLGVLVEGNKFSVSYNGFPVGDVSDTSLQDAGTLGVVVGTGKAPNDTTSIRFSNFIVTLPIGETPPTPLTVPDKLVYWQRTQDPILQELQTARLVPGLGKIGLELKTRAFVTNNTVSGIVTKPLAADMSFTDLVFSSDITWESSNDNIACAMELRAADDNNFTIVYIDRKGGYGIRQASKTDSSAVAIYNLSDLIKKDNLGTNRVTIIAIGNNLIIYINGGLIANLNVQQTSGGVRIAAYNYQRASSLCQFTNLWLQSFDK